jgi:hypothetical protein
MEVLVAIDAVDELLTLPAGSSKRSVKRVDPAQLDAAIEHLRAEVTAALSDAGRLEALPLVEGLANLARSARKIPAIGGVLMNRPRAYDLLDELRQVVPRAIIAQRQAGSD